MTQPETSDSILDRLEARENGKERLAIMREVKCGVTDRGTAALYFSIYISEGSAALQVLGWDRARELIEAAQVTDVHELNGRPCWVDASRPGLLMFIDLAKL